MVFCLGGGVVPDGSVACVIVPSSQPCGGRRMKATPPPATREQNLGRATAAVTSSPRSYYTLPYIMM